MTNIITLAAHDAADATRCSPKGKKCIFKVRWAGGQSRPAPSEQEDLTVFVGSCFREGGMGLAEQLLNRSAPEVTSSVCVDQPSNRHIGSEPQSLLPKELMLTQAKIGY